MPTFIVALMVVVLLVIALSVVLLLTKALRREGDAVERARGATRSETSTPPTEER